MSLQEFNVKKYVFIFIIIAIITIIISIMCDMIIVVQPTASVAQLSDNSVEYALAKSITRQNMLFIKEITICLFWLCCAYFIYKDYNKNKENKKENKQNDKEETKTNE